MGRRLQTLVVLGALAAATLGVAPPADAGRTLDVIVVLDDDVRDRGAAARDTARDHRVSLRFVYEHALGGFAGQVPEGRLRALQRDPRVASVELDQTVTIAAQTVPTGVRRIFADDNPNLDIDGTDDLRVDVDVAVLDTGIDFEHPDLDVLEGKSVNCLESSGGPPWSRTYTCAAGGDDDHYHGTHVAGTVGALDNGEGVVGVAPGARLWAVKVLDSQGSGAMGAIVAGIDYVTAHAAEVEVANMSLGCECSSSALDTALAESVAAGVTYAVAAGNSDADAATFSPANHPDVITVSALADFDGEPGGLGAPTCRTDEDDTLAGFSNFGSLIEITAPGVCILSTYPLEQGGYGTISGTSMASPHVAGAAALLASKGDGPASIRTTLLAEGNLDWTDDSGDGIQEPLLDVSDATVFAPATLSTGDGSGDTVAPTVTLDDPAEGATVSGTVPLSATATDTSGIARVEFLVDGALVATDTSSEGGWTGSWDSTGAADGSHTVTARAVDASSNANTADDSHTVTVDNVAGTTDTAVVSSLTGTSQQGPGPNRDVTVTAAVTDGSGAAVPGATVAGTWHDGTTASCTTGTAGTCSVTGRFNAKKTSSATYTVTGVTADGYVYDPDNSTTSVTVSW